MDSSQILRLRLEKHDTTKKVF